MAKPSVRDKFYPLQSMRNNIWQPCESNWAVQVALANLARILTSKLAPMLLERRADIGTFPPSFTCSPARLSLFAPIHPFPLQSALHARENLDNRTGFSRQSTVGELSATATVDVVVAATSIRTKFVLSLSLQVCELASLCVVG